MQLGDEAGVLIVPDLCFAVKNEFLEVLLNNAVFCEDCSQAVFHVSWALAARTWNDELTGTCGVTQARFAAYEEPGQVFS